MSALSVWVLAQQDKPTWELGGIFTSEERAIAACKVRTDGYWEVPLNEDLGRETVIIEAAIFPLLNIPEGWHLIAPDQAEAGDAILLPDDTFTLLDVEMFEKFAIELRRQSFAIRRNT
jgi:hypothetical protein